MRVDRYAAETTGRSMSETAIVLSPRVYLQWLLSKLGHPFVQQLLELFALHWHLSHLGQ